MRAKVVAFDAMGVLYSSRDDVTEILLPYLQGLGSPLPDDEIKKLYTECSLGTFDSAEFWRRCGVPGDDYRYTSRHRLTEGMPELLQELSARNVRLACLSNDVATWSRLLRERFGLMRWIDTWVISAEIQVRKPSRAAYAELRQALHSRPENIMFIDDRKVNVLAAHRYGFCAVEYENISSLRETIGQWLELDG